MTDLPIFDVAQEEWLKLKHRLTSQRYRDNHPGRASAANQRWRKKHPELTVKQLRQENTELRELLTSILAIFDLEPTVQ